MYTLVDTMRLDRSKQPPTVGGLPDQPGILAAMALSPKLGEHLRGVAHALLYDDFPGATLSRGEREVIAAWVSAGNTCCFCTDSHTAFARELAKRENRDFEPHLTGDAAASRANTKLRALIDIAELVRESGLMLEPVDAEAAKKFGASDGDIQVTILIAAAFSMFNRMVDGLRAPTPSSPDAFIETALRIAERGYVAP